MEKNETVERFTESMKKAASRAKDLAKAQKNNQWLGVASGLEALLAKGQVMLNARAITRQEALDFLDDRENKKKLH